MKITCHSCGAKYTVSDEKVQGKTVKMKCRKCGATIVVGGSSQADGGPGDGALDDGVAHASAEAGEGPPPGSYLVSVAEGDQRTMTVAEVVEAYNAGVVTADTYVFADGMNDWQALSENEVIVAALNEAALASASLTAANGGAGYGAFPSSSSPAPDPRPAAARRDAGRKSQDLFGGGYGGEPAMGSASMSTQSAIGSAPGKRDENSVLFSLNALTASTPQARPSATTATKEDSGLIDLKALSANAAPAAPAAAAAAPVVDAVGLFPLGAPVLAPPPVASPGYAAAPAAAPGGQSKLGLIIGGVIAVCAVIIVFLLVSRPDPKPETASTSKKDTETTATATAQAQAQPSATAPATATETAVASATETTSASAAAAPTVGKGWKGAPKTTGAKTGTAPAATGGPKTPPKGACGCAPSDLNCALKCSVGKK